MPQSSIPITVDSIDDRPGGVRVLTCSPLQPFPFRAGQYARLLVEGHEPRAFSLAAGPDSAGRLTFHIRNIGTGLSQHLATELRAGDIIAAEGPFGGMDAEAARGRPVLMIAGGTGIAPILALAFDIIRRGVTDEGITLIYGVRQEHDVYCRRELDQLLATGEVTAHVVADTLTPDQQLRRLGLNLAHHAVFVSGPDPMMLSVQSCLLDHLADPSRIYSDADMNMLTKDLA